MQLKKWIVIAISAVSLLALSGCAAGRKDIHLKYYCDKSTIEEVKAQLGEPVLQEVSANRAKYFYGGPSARTHSIFGEDTSPRFFVELCDSNGNNCKSYKELDDDAVMFIFENGTVHSVNLHRVDTSGKTYKCWANINHKEMCTDSF